MEAWKPSTYRITNISGVATTDRTFFLKNKLRMEQLLIHLHHFRICYIIKFLQKLVKMLNFMLCIFYNRKKLKKKSGPKGKQ